VIALNFLPSKQLLPKSIRLALGSCVLVVIRAIQEQNPLWACPMSHFASMLRSRAVNAVQSAHPGQPASTIRKQRSLVVHNSSSLSSVVFEENTDRELNSCQLSSLTGRVPCTRTFQTPDDAECMLQSAAPPTIEDARRPLGRPPHYPTMRTHCCVVARVLVVEQRPRPAGRLYPGCSSVLRRP
jgi:hypothetical protein